MTPLLLRGLSLWCCFHIATRTRNETASYAARSKSSNVFSSVTHTAVIRASGSNLVVMKGGTPPPPATALVTEGKKSERIPKKRHERPKVAGVSCSESGCHSYLAICFCFFTYEVYIYMPWQGFVLRVALSVYSIKKVVLR